MSQYRRGRYKIKFLESSAQLSAHTTEASYCHSTELKQILWVKVRLNVLLRVGFIWSPRGGPCSLVPFQNCPMFPCSHTLSECFRTVMFRILFPCSQKLANVPLFPSIFCQCSLVPQNPWETLRKVSESVQFLSGTT